MNKLVIIIVSVVFFSIDLLGQQSKIDSLSALSETLGQDTNKVNVLSALTYELSYGNKDEAMKMASQSMSLAKSLKYEKGIANVNNLYGIIFLDKGDLDSAQIYFMKALRYYEDHNLLRKMISSYQKIAQVHALRNSFDQAEFYYNKEFELADQVGDDRLLGNAHNSRGSFYMNQGWDIIDNKNDTINYLSYFEQAIPHIHKAIDHFKKAEYNKGVALAYGNLSILKLEMGDLDAALDYMVQASVFFEKMDYKIYLVTAYNQINKIYQKKKSYDSALMYIEKGMDLAKEIESKFDIRNAHGDFARVYEQQGNYQKSLEHHQLYDDVNSVILDENKQAQIDELEVKYQSEKTEKNLQLQQAENERQRVILISSIVTALALLVVAFFLWRKNKNVNQLNSLLEEQKGELENKNEEILQQSAQQEESNQLISKQNAKLKEAYNEQNNLMAVVAHDLRSPFNKVKGLSEIMRMTPPLTKEQMELNAKTSEVVEGGLALITDIMNLSKFQSGAEASIKQCNLNDLLSSIVESHTSYSLRKEISINCQASQKEYLIYTDKGFLTRILDNLISNAIKFSPHKSTVEVSFQASDENVTISIVDEGPGMTSDDLEHVFERFKRLSARPTGGENSTGLGLSIVKTLVDKLQGSVHIDTKVGEGSTFRVILPAG